METLEIQKKECTKCKQEKEITEFYKQKYTTKKKGIEYILKPECKECTKLRSRKWSIDNPESVLKANRKMNDKRREFLKEYKRINKEVYKKNLKRWIQNNPEKIKEYNAFREQNKKHEISFSEWEHCKTYFNNECAYCGMLEDHHKQIHKQQLHKEHVEHNGANDLSNCVPACRSCNSSKRQYKLEEWYNESNTNYTKDRLERIKKWVTRDHKKFIIKNN